MKDVTRILSQIQQGDPSAADRLLSLVYNELRTLAAAKMAHESPDHSLQATALVHEAYLRLVDVDLTKKWDSRGHFFSAAAEAMRRILVESARRKLGPKRGGGFERQVNELDGLPSSASSPDLLSVHEALNDLADEDPPAAKLVELRYFAGLTLKEAATALGVSNRTADRLWAYAKAWLHQTLSKADGN